jgi:type VI secretion system protein VasI
VLTRLGQEQASTEEWSLSTDSKATFYPGNPVPYIKKMMVNDSFVAQVTPYNESPVTATFDIKGLARAIEPLIQTCHWDQQENITQTQP